IPTHPHPHPPPLGAGMFGVGWRLLLCTGLESDTQDICMALLWVTSEPEATLPVCPNRDAY
ncbi:hypothetical protein, partial [Chloroflexus sp.]|uniref:hypothetical protein n=1 Tax=Chloroflexus sp. TaxID=1904827 RepID=UPI0040496C0E